VIHNIIILDNEVITALKSTTMNSKAHTETSHSATSCRCDQVWKAKSSLMSLTTSTAKRVPHHRACHKTRLAQEDMWYPALAQQLRATSKDSSDWYKTPADCTCIKSYQPGGCETLPWSK